MGARVDFERVLLAGPLFKMRTRARAEMLELDECGSFVSSPIPSSLFLPFEQSILSIEGKIRFNERVTIKS